ncbi:hypothetical protein LZ575_20810 [Antarcticibacterium sp. 1MA-6-2]|uniref:hypothetical protein n=1 Tax=Antarcticibacterium sp. 1MA-6-2 TaxID=2908210 RepID=UPI001F466684|nr:hypothetical protein [Antarcticibacterium sp. 1MA-6-2]UJH91071.1 hypothetical protein LZ575_20810 [Antarcticibacterium sp. 1MA-6-2]
MKQIMPFVLSETVTFTATAQNAGTSPKFQWRVNGINQGSNGSNTTFPTPSNFQTGSIVTVVLTPDCENSSPVTSNSISTTVNALPTVNAGTAVSPICQGGTTGPLGGSYGGGATSAVWTADVAGGTFSNNSGNTPNTATYTAASNAQGIITLTLTTSGGSCGTVSATKALSINPNPTVNVGGNISAICQGGTTSALGGSFGGGATGAIWSDGGAGGTFANNSGSTPNTATYTAASNAPSSITLTLTTAGGSCGAISATKAFTVNPNPTVNA